MWPQRLASHAKRSRLTRWIFLAPLHSGKFAAPCRSDRKPDVIYGDGIEGILGIQVDDVAAVVNSPSAIIDVAVGVVKAEDAG